MLYAPIVGAECCYSDLGEMTYGDQDSGQVLWKPCVSVSLLFIAEGW